MTHIISYFYSLYLFVFRGEDGISPEPDWGYAPSAFVGLKVLNFISAIFRRGLGDRIQVMGSNGILVHNICRWSMAIHRARNQLGIIPAS